MGEPLLIGKGEAAVYLQPAMANRHGAGPVSSAQRHPIIESSVGTQEGYDDEVDRRSADEILQARAEQAARLSERETQQSSRSLIPRRSESGRQTMLEALGKSAMRRIGTQNWTSDRPRSAGLSVGKSVLAQCVPRSEEPSQQTATHRRTARNIAFTCRVVRGSMPLPERVVCCIVIGQ